MASRIVRCRSGRSRGTAGQERQARSSRAQQRRRGQVGDPGRRQLDRQRQPVQPAADLGDGGGVLGGQREVGPGGLGALDEEPHRV